MLESESEDVDSGDGDGDMTDLETQRMLDMAIDGALEHDQEKAHDIELEQEENLDEKMCKFVWLSKFTTPVLVKLISINADGSIRGHCYNTKTARSKVYYPSWTDTRDNKETMSKESPDTTFYHETVMDFNTEDIF